MKLFLIFLFLTTMLSCARYEPQTEDDQYRQIQTQIDHKEYDRAENTLNEILTQNPSNQRARVILASLYVHRAGITLKDYFGLEKLSHLNSKPSQPAIELKSMDASKVPEKSDFAKALNLLEQVNVLAGQTQDIFEKFNQVPVVDEAGAEDLYRAWQELEKIENPDDGKALYRGVVKLFYFKYLWKSGKVFQFGNQKFCSLEISDLDAHLSELETYIVGMLQDAAHGFPKSSQAFQKQVKDLDRNFQSARESLRSLKISDQTVKEATEKLAKQQSIEGFKCEF